MGLNKCRYECGTEVQFDPAKVSKSGKMIPLEGDGSPHNCPNNPFLKQQKGFKYGFTMSKENGYITIGNMIFMKWEFCPKCHIYKGLLTTSNGGMVVCSA